MKHCYACLFFLLLLFGGATGASASVVLSEDFASASWPANWSRSVIFGSENWKLQDNPVMSSPSGGNYMIFDDASLGAGNFPNAAQVTSPTIDLSNHTDVKLSYAHHWEGVESTFGFVEVWDGSSWTTLETLEKVTQGSYSSPQLDTLDLTPHVANTPGVKIRFRYTDSSNAGQFWAIDDIKVFSSPDVGAIGLLTPDYLVCDSMYSEPNITDQVGSGTPSASGSAACSSPADAVDGDPNRSKWVSTNSLPATFEYDYGSGNDLLVNEYQIFSDTVTGTGLAFDGNDDYVDIDESGFGNNDPFGTSNTDFSLSLWFRADAFDPNQTNHDVRNVLFANASSSSNDNFELGVHSNKVDLYLDTDNGNDENNIDVSLGQGEWHHLAVTRSDTAGLFVYLDGIEIFNDPASTASFDGSGPNIAIGRSNNQGSPFTGVIDEVRLWDHQRTQSEIQSSKDAALTGTESGLFAYWDLDDGTGSGTAADQSPNSHNGTLTNMDPANDWVFAPIGSSCLPADIGAAQSWEFQGFDGSSWTTLDAQSNVGLQNGRFNTFPINNTTAYESYRLRITDVSGATNHVNIGELVLNDVQPTGEGVTVRVQNFGVDPVSNVPVTVEMQGGNTATLSGTIPGPINPGTNVDFTLPGDVNMFPDTSYVFTAYSDLGSDRFRSNDTIIASRRQRIRTYPDVEDFSNSFAGWRVSGHNDPKFVQGPLPSGYLGGPDGEGNSIYVETNGNNNEDIWIESPVYDLSELQNPVVILDIKLDLRNDNWDNLFYIQYSTDNGSNWNTLGNNSDPNWYSVSPDGGTDGWGNGTINVWTEVRHNLCNLAGNNCVRFRMQGRDIDNGDEFAFDNFSVVDGIDVGLTTFNQPLPNNDCDASGQETVEIEIINNSCGLAFNVPVSYQVNGPSIAKTVKDTVISIDPATTKSFTFEETYNGLDTGLYTIKAWSAEPSDFINSNDTITLTKDVNNIPVTAYPDTNAFNSSDGNWNSVKAGGGTTGFEWGEGPSELDFPGNKEIPIDTFYNSTDIPEFTAEAWLKTTDGSRQIISAFDASEYWRFSINDGAAGTGEVNIRINTNSGDLNLASTSRIDDGSWHHVAAVYDNGNASIYVDGNLENTASQGTGFGSGSTRYGFVGVGSEASSFDGSTGPNDHYTGQMDGVRVWSTARTQTQINNRMSDSLSGTEPGLMYNINRAIADTANESKHWFLVTGGTNSVDPYIVSGLYDLSEETNPTLKMDLNFDLRNDNWDNLFFVEYSTDNGNNWNTLGSNADPDWYGISPDGGATGWGNGSTGGNWVTASQELCPVSGESCVMFRVRGRDIDNGDQFAFDNFIITDGEGDDLEPIAIYPPGGGNCSGYGSSEALGVLVQNNTCRPLEEVPITLEITGPNGSTHSETISSTVPDFGQEYYNFASVADMTAPGDYQLRAYTGSNPSGEGLAFIDDTAAANDTIFETRYNTKQDTFNYVSDFNQHNEGWASAPLNFTGTYFDYGPAGSNLDFNGNGDYVPIPDFNYGAGGQPEFTVETRIKTTNSGEQIIAAYDASEYWRFAINDGAAGAGQVNIGINTNSGDLNLASSSRIDDGNWHHVAAVYDNGTATIYVDGVAENTTNQGSTFGSGTTRYGMIGVGSEASSFDGNTGPSDYFEGQMDEVRVWTTARSSSEISNNQNDTLSGSEPGLVALSNRASEEDFGNGWNIVAENSNEDPWVESPIFDLSGTTNPMLSMFVRFSLRNDNWDNLFRVEYSTNGGSSWSTLGNNSDPDWYSISPDGGTSGWGNGTTKGWEQARHDLCNLTGENCVQFRVRGRDIDPGDDFSFDNFKIEDGFDVGVTDFLRPVSSNECITSTEQEIEVEVTNFSCDTAKDVPVVAEVAGPTNKTLLDTVDAVPPAQTVAFTFGETFDGTAPGTYNFTSYTEEPSDFFRDNDTTRWNRNVTFEPVDSFPSLKTFNSDSADWISFPQGNAEFKWGQGPGPLDFSGNDDLPIDTFYNSTDIPEFTTEAWLKTTDGSQQIISAFDASEYWRFSINDGAAGTGEVNIRINTNSGNLNVASTSRIDDGTWHHVAAVYDNGTATIYIDGTAENTASQGTGFGSGTTRYGYVGVGSEASNFDGSTGPNDHFSGQMDGIRVWNTARTSTQINNNMSDSLGGTGSQPGLTFNTNRTLLDTGNTSNHWYMDANGANSQDPYVTTSLYNFTEASDPHLRMDVKFDLRNDNWDNYFFVEYSTDGGSSWTKLGDNSDPNWYSISPDGGADGWGNGTIPTWTQVEHDLCPMAGESCVTFRIKGNDIDNGDEFAVDNFEVVDKGNDDLQPIAIYPPGGGSCSGLFSSSEDFGVLMQNNSCRPVEDVPVEVKVSGPLNSTDTVIFSNQIPRNGQAYQNFPGLLDLSAAGTYTIEVISGSDTSGTGLSFVSDSTPGNDSLSRTRFNAKTDTFPYSADFNQHNEGWASGPLSMTGTYFNYQEAPSDLFFNGSSDYLPIPDFSYNSSGNTAFTAEAWLKTNNGSEQIIMAYDASEYFRLGINTGSAAGTGEVGAVIETDAGQANLASSTLVSDDNWHHVALVFDNGNIRLLVDGAEEANINQGSTFGTGTTRYGMVGVGSEAGSFDGNKGPNDHFDGQMDGVRFWSQARSNSQIMGQMSDSLTASEPGLEFVINSSIEEQNSREKGWHLVAQNNDEDPWVESPIFDLSSMANPVLTAEVQFNLKNDNWDNLIKVDYSTDGGSSWNTLGDNSDPEWYSISPDGGTSGWGNGSVANWTPVRHDLCNLLGENCVKFRFRGRDIDQGDDFGFDNFEITEGTDLGVTGFVGPVDNDDCISSENQQVTVEVTNNSCSSVSDVPVELQISGPFTGTFLDTIPSIPAATTQNFTFSQTYDGRPAGTYTFTAFTKDAADINLGNDTTSWSRTVDYDAIESYPFEDDFEGSFASWEFGNAGNAEWKQDTVPYLGGAEGNGESIYMDAPNGNDSEDPWIASQLFDLSETKNPIVSFDLKFDLRTDNWDNLFFVEYSTDGGASWSKLGTNADPDWYSISPDGGQDAWGNGTISDWTRVRHDVCFLLGESCVRFRMQGRDIDNGDQFAFDNFRVSDPPIDMEVLGLDGCWGDTAGLEVQVRNIARCLSTSPVVENRTDETSASASSALACGPADHLNDGSISTPWVSSGTLEQEAILDYGSGNGAIVSHYNLYADTTSGLGLSFDGSNERVDLNTSGMGVADPFGQNSTDWTVEAWVRPDNLSSSSSNHNIRNVFFANAGGGIDDNFELGVHTDRIEVYTETNGGNTENSFNVGSLSPGNWYHIAVSKSSANGLRVYLDGTQVATDASLTGSMDVSNTQGFDMAIGRTNNSGVAFDGKVDEVRVWNDERTASEIQNNRNSTLGGSEANLFMYYTFEDGSGSTLTDKTGNGRDGTLQNMESGDWVPGKLGSSGGSCATNDHGLPDSWYFEAYDGASWVGLDTVTNAALANATWTQFNTGNSTSYERYRLRITGVTPGKNKVLLNEMELKNIFDLSVKDLDIEYEINGNSQIEHFSGLDIGQGEDTTLIINNVTVPDTNSSVRATTMLPNGQVDQFTENSSDTANLDLWPKCNDNCQQATELLANITQASQTSNATTDPAEDPSFEGCGSITLENTVWYFFTTDSIGGDVTFQISNTSCQPSNNGIQVSIVEVTSPICDTSNYTEVFCAAPGDLSDITWDPNNLDSNNTYYVAVDGFANNDCDFDIQLSGAVVLPLRLAKFTARPLGEDALLEWRIMNPQDAAYYQLQKTAQNRGVETFARIDAPPEVPKSDYTFLDTEPYEGLSYYRLKMVDKNGEVNYSNWKPVEFGPGQVTMRIFPNPVIRGQGLNLYLSGEYCQDQPHAARLVDAEGSLVWQDRELPAPADGHQHLRLDGEKLAEGIYILHYKTGCRQWQRRVRIE